MATPAQVNETFLAAVYFIAFWVVVGLLWYRAEEHGPTNARRLWDWLAARYLAVPDAQDDTDLLSSDTRPGTENAGSTRPEPVCAPPIPVTERDVIAALARLRGDDGTYRYSANEITKFIKLSRNDVLAIIRPERDGSSEIPDTYQAEPVTPRRLEFARTLDNGVVVRVDQWGNEFVQVGNQTIPLDLYQPSEAAP